MKLRKAQRALGGFFHPPKPIRPCPALTLGNEGDPRLIAWPILHYVALPRRGNAQKSSGGNEAP